MVLIVLLELHKRIGYMVKWNKPINNNLYK